MTNKVKKIELVEATITYHEMELAISNINRRLDELKQFNINSISAYNDPCIEAYEHKINNLLKDLYGINTIEYESYKYIADFSPSSYSPSTPSLSEIQSHIEHRIKRAITILETIKQNFQEKIQDANIDKSKKAMKAYEHLELHPAIAEAASELFYDGHYSNAIEDAVKALNDVVRLNSGVVNKDGVALMQHVFSAKNPILKFNSSNDEYDQNEQKGLMNLFEGAVAGLRNPRAHKIIQDDPERALEFIGFISLLAKLADEAEK